MGHADRQRSRLRLEIQPQAGTVIAAPTGARDASQQRPILRLVPVV